MENTKKIRNILYFIAGGFSILIAIAFPFVKNIEWLPLIQEVSIAFGVLCIVEGVSKSAIAKAGAKVFLIGIYAITLFVYIIFEILPDEFFFAFRLSNMEHFAQWMASFSIVMDFTIIPVAVGFDIVIHYKSKKLVPVVASK